MDMGHTLEDTPFKRSNREYEWWTYAGLAANALLAAKMTTAGGRCRAIYSFGIRVEMAPDALKQAGGWTHILELSPTPDELNHVRLKFSDLIPTNRLEEILLSRLLSEASARKRS